MKQYLKPFLIILPVLLIVLFYLYTLSKRSEFPELGKEQALGKKAYETLDIAELSDWKGNSIKVAQAAEPVIIMHFWGSWCGPCIHEFPDLINLAKSLKGQIQVFAISEDNNKDEIQAFIKSFKEAENVENFHIVWDEGHKIMNSWGVDKLPESYIFDSSRKMVKHVGGAVTWTSDDSREYFKMLLSKSPAVQ